MLGARVRVASPHGYELPDRVIAQARGIAADGGAVERCVDPRDAVRGADAVYTDVWASMGEEGEAEDRKVIFAPYQVNRALMALAAPDAHLHALPARASRRGGDRRGHRIARVRRVRPGREPPAHAEGAAADCCWSGRSGGSGGTGGQVGQVGSEHGDATGLRMSTIMPLQRRSSLRFTSISIHQNVCSRDVAESPRDVQAVSRAPRAMPRPCAESATGPGRRTLPKSFQHIGRD